MDGLKAKLETAYKASGGKKVNIISHSMGGLLLRCFITLHHEVSTLLISLIIYPVCCIMNAHLTNFYTVALRCFIISQVFAKYVNKWICIACPFQGNEVNKKNLIVLPLYNIIIVMLLFQYMKDI